MVQSEVKTENVVVNLRELSFLAHEGLVETGGMK